MLVASIPIPPRPSLLSDLQCELDRPEPNLKLVARVVEKDVALAGAFMKTVNSAFFRCVRKVETIEAALTRLGLNQVTLLAGGFLVKQSFQGKNFELTNFWEQSSLRSTAMAYLARELRAGSPDLARSFGLFADLGMPLLMERFDDYPQVLKLAQAKPHRSLAEIEDEHYGTNHAVIGALLARNWQLPDEVVAAIQLHHDHSVLMSSQWELPIRRLIALSILSDIFIQHYMGQGTNGSAEQGAALAMDELEVSSEELRDLDSVLREIFSQDN
jgi:HD-like signal output (HDOD) protein